MDQITGGSKRVVSSIGGAWGPMTDSPEWQHYYDYWLLMTIITVSISINMIINIINIIIISISSSSSSSSSNIISSIIVMIVSFTSDSEARSG